ncbi:MAG: AAA family ATPase, partial [Clostridia bacterium]|nr:AAA family ATPase [Clostridia bacterium]
KQVTADKDEAVTNQNFERAAELRDIEKRLLVEIEVKKAEFEVNRKEAGEAAIGEAEIAEVVAQWTGVPTARLTGDEGERMLRLEDALHEKVIGQDEAVSALARAIRRARAGLKDPARPIGSFLFLGPSGVGKTQLARRLAEVLFGEEKAMIRIDMSEYEERHTLARLIGSPPGYIGHDEGGQLTEAVRKRPYSVVLFDEIDKAHPDVFNAFLQIFEDGRLTDGRGRTVDFRNTVLIMTSNTGATLLKRGVMGFGATGGGLDHEKMRDTIMTELKKQFRPEFLNRIDETIIFTALKEEDMRAIADLMVDQTIERLAEQGVSLTVDTGVREYLASQGFDELYGARPLRRFIQRTLEDALAEELLAGKVKLGDKVVCEMDGESLRFRH